MALSLSAKLSLSLRRPARLVPHHGQAPRAAARKNQAQGLRLWSLFCYNIWLLRKREAGETVLGEDGFRQDSSLGYIVSDRSISSSSAGGGPGSSATFGSALAMAKGRKKASQ